MAGGQGFKGNVGTGEGVYISIVMDAGDAIVKAQQLDGEVDNLATSMRDLSGQAEVTTSQFEELEFVFDKTGDSAGGAGTQLDGFMVNATMAVSGLNQLTGSLYKTIGGLEALGVINEDTARQWQENARMIEAFTGPLEFAISMVILYQAAVLAGFIPATTAASGASLGFAASMSAAAASVGAFMIAAAPFVLIGFIIVGVVFLIMSNLEGLKKIVDGVVDGFASLASIASNVAGSVTGLTSSVTGLGDAFTDNPLMKMLGKAGGALV